MTKNSIKISIVLASILQTGMFALTLEEASQDVFNNNPEIKERLEHYRDTKHDYEIAKSGFMPKIDLSATTGKEKYRNIPDANPTAPSATFTTNNTKTYGATLNQNLFNGFGSYYDLQAQKGRVTSSEQYLKEKSDEILLNIVQNYINSLRKYQQLQIEKENVESHKKTYEKIKERKDVGYSTVSDLWQAESRYVLAQSNLVSSELAYQDSLANFAKVYGKEVMAQNLVRPEFEMQLPNSLDDAISAALANNPTIKTEEYNAAVVKSQYRGSYSSFYPKLDFDLSATRSLNTQGTLGQIDSYSGAFKLYYNLFNGFSDVQKTKKYLVSINSQTATLETAKQKVVEKLRLAWDSYILVTKQLEFLKQHTELSKKTVDAYDEEFLLGRRTIIDLLGAASEYNSAKRELIGTEYDLLYAKYRVYDAMYGLTDALVKKGGASDNDMKSVLFKNLSPDAMDSEKRIQKALEKNKKQAAAEAPVVVPVPQTPDVVPVSTPDTKPVAQQEAAPATPIQETPAPKAEAQASLPAEAAPVAQPEAVTPPVAPVAVAEPAPTPVDNSNKIVDETPKATPTPESEPAAKTSEQEAPKVNQSSEATTEKCYKVSTNKLITRQSASEKSKKVGYLLKNWKACSEVNKDGWIKLPNGWASTKLMTPMK